MARQHRTTNRAKANAQQAEDRRRGGGERRAQASTWLGAGALTVGVGAALASGSGLAHADTAGTGSLPGGTTTGVGSTGVSPGSTGPGGAAAAAAAAAALKAALSSLPVPALIPTGGGAPVKPAVGAPGLGIGATGATGGIAAFSVAGSPAATTTFGSPGLPGGTTFTPAFTPTKHSPAGIVSPAVTGSGPLSFTGVSGLSGITAQFSSPQSGPGFTAPTGGVVSSLVTTPTLPTALIIKAPVIPTPVVTAPAAPSVETAINAIARVLLVAGGLNPANPVLPSPANPLQQALFALAVRLENQFDPAPAVATPTVGTADPGTGTVTGSAVFAGDPSGDLTFSGPANNTSAGGGSVTVNATTGAFTYTPSAGQRQAATATSTDHFAVTVHDGLSTNTETVTVPVDPGTPQAGTPTVGSPDANGVVTGAAVFTDPGGRTLHYSAPATSTGGGAVSINTTTGAFTFTPSAAQQQAAALAGTDSTDSFTVTATNGVHTNTEIMTVTVDPGTPQPATPTVGTPDANGMVTGTAVFTTPNPEALRYSAPTTSTEGGAVSINTTTGAFTYIPATLARVQAANGGATTDSFTVTASNGVHTSPASSINVQISPLPDTPTAPAATGTQNVSSAGMVTGTVSATDPAGLPLTYSVASQPSDGTVTVTSAGAFTYTPTTLARVQAANGGATTDSFTATATNGVYSSPAGTIGVSISPLSDTPAAPASTGAPTTSSAGVVTGTVSATDPAGLPLTYSVASQPSDGTVTVTSAGAFTYTPTTLARVQAANGGATTDSFTATATNGVYSSPAGTIGVSISPLSDTPAAPASTGAPTTSSAGVVTGTVSATDPAGLPLTYSVTTQPTDGTVTVTSAGAFTYTPTTLARVQAANGGATTDSFTVTASNRVTTSSASTIAVSISPLSDTPTTPAVTGINNINADTTTIGVGSQPVAVALSRNGATAYVLNFGSIFPATPGTVSVINTATNTVTATIPVGYQPNGLALSPDGRTVYVTDHALVDGNYPVGEVSVIDTASNTVTATIPVGGRPVGVAASPNDLYVYVANAGSPSVQVINTETNTVTATIYNGVGTGIGGGAPAGLAVSPNGATVYLTNADNNTLSAIDTATNLVTAIIPVGGNPLGVALSPNGATAYVVNGADGTVSVINTATDTVTATIDVGGGQPHIYGTYPSGVAVSPNGATAYVAIGGRVSVINTATDTVTAAIPGGPGVALSPDGNLAYVTNGNTVSVINLADFPSGVVTGTVRATDPAGLPLTYSVASQPADGSVTVTSAGAFTYTPTTLARVQAADGGATTDSFTVTASNGVTTSSPATVSVNIIPRTDTPTIATGINNINTVTASIGVGTYPYEVAVSPTGATAYVTNYFSNTVSVINTATNTVTTIGVGTYPYGVAVSPTGAKRYVTNAGDGTVSVINTATDTVTATIPVGTPRSGWRSAPTAATPTSPTPATTRCR